MSNIRYTKEILEDAAKNSASYAGILRYLNLKYAGGTQAHLTRKVKEYGIDTSHFTGRAHNKGKVFQNKRRSAESILVLRNDNKRQKPSLLVRALLESGIKHECNKCGQLPLWLGNPLTLDVDHINQNWLDDRIENLRFLCPNCHSQFSRNLLAL